MPTPKGLVKNNLLFSLDGINDGIFKINKNYMKKLLMIASAIILLASSATAQKLVKDVIVSFPCRWTNQANLFQ